MTRPFSLYVHIPYCAQKCPYCDFNTYAVSKIPEEEYRDALIAELSLRAERPEWKRRELRSIYFGGGTPSIFSPSSISRIIENAAMRFPVSPFIEISLEANPGNVRRVKLQDLKECGVNRISLGAQSFNEKVLLQLGRRHGESDIMASISDAINVGISNLSIDLMFGVPSQTLDQVCEDIETAASLPLAHVSLYGLTIEEGTPFFRDFTGGKLKLPPEETVLKMMSEIDRRLSAHKFERYEISNYAKKGFEARHNVGYWEGGDYLGLGAGAHSYYSIDPKESGGKTFGHRWSNLALPDRFINSVSKSRPGDSKIAEAWSEDLNRANAVFEFFLLGLRKIDGVSLSKYESRFGRALREEYSAILDLLIGSRLLRIKGDKAFLTQRGLAVSDTVIEGFIPHELVDKKRVSNF